MQKSKLLKGGLTLLLLFTLTSWLLPSILTPVSSIQAADIPNGNRKEVHHKGPLIISGKQTFVIKDTIYHQTGNIIVRDNAKLVATDATLRIGGFTPDIWGNWVQIHVEDSASIEMHSVTVETPGGGVWIFTGETSQVLLDRVQTTLGDGVYFTAGGESSVDIRDSVLTEFRIKDRANAHFHNSKVTWAIDLRFSESFPVEVEKLAPGLFISWEFPENQPVPFYISLSDTEVGAWSVHVIDKAKVTVKDSVLDRLALFLNGASGSLSGLRPGPFPSWNLHKDNQIDCAADVTLRNTIISEPWTLRLFGRAALDIADSSISGLSMFGTYVELSLINVEIAAIKTSRITGNLTFEDSLITRGFQWDTIMLAVNGELSFSVRAHVARWQDSFVTREYVVSVKEEDGSPVRGVSLQLTSPEGQQVFSGTTDAQGRTKFRLTFTDDNYQDEWILKATFPNGKVITRSIGFLTDTPIEIRAGS